MKGYSSDTLKMRIKNIINDKENVTHPNNISRGVSRLFDNNTQNIANKLFWYMEVQGTLKTPEDLELKRFIENFSVNFGNFQVLWEKIKKHYAKKSLSEEEKVEGKDMVDVYINLLTEFRGNYSLLKEKQEEIFPPKKSTKVNKWFNNIINKILRK